MPDYEAAASKAGWTLDGTKWTHRKHPGKIYGNAREIYNEVLPEDYKRPPSATPRPPEIVKAMEPIPGIPGMATDEPSQLVAKKGK